MTEGHSVGVASRVREKHASAPLRLPVSRELELNPVITIARTAFV